MQDRTTIGGRRVSAGYIIDAQTGRTEGDDYLSEIGGETIVWSYRRHYDEQGIYGDRSSACSPVNADSILIDFGAGFPIDEGRRFVTLRLSDADRKWLRRASEGHGGPRPGSGRKPGALGHAINIPLRLPRRLLRAVEAEAVERDISRTEVIVRILTRSMRQRGRL